MSAFASREAAGRVLSEPGVLREHTREAVRHGPIKSSPAVSCGALSARARRCASASPKLRPRSRSSESVSPSPAVETVRARSEGRGPGDARLREKGLPGGLRERLAAAQEAHGAVGLDALERARELRRGAYRREGRVQGGARVAEGFQQLVAVLAAAELLAREPAAGDDGGLALMARAGLRRDGEDAAPALERGARGRPATRRTPSASSAKRSVSVTEAAEFESG